MLPDDHEYAASCIDLSLQCSCAILRQPSCREVARNTLPRIVSQSYLLSWDLLLYQLSYASAGTPIPEWIPQVHDSVP
jgi:hypothetical protein